MCTASGVKGKQTAREFCDFLACGKCVLRLDVLRTSNGLASQIANRIVALMHGNDVKNKIQLNSFCALNL